MITFIILIIGLFGGLSSLTTLQVICLFILGFITDAIFSNR